MRARTGAGRCAGHVGQPRPAPWQRRRRPRPPRLGGRRPHRPAQVRRRIAGHRLARATWPAASLWRLGVGRAAPPPASICMPQAMPPAGRDQAARAAAAVGVPTPARRSAGQRRLQPPCSARHHSRATHRAHELGCARARAQRGGRRAHAAVPRRLGPRPPRGRQPAQPPTVNIDAALETARESDQGALPRPRLLLRRRACPGLSRRCEVASLTCRLTGEHISTAVSPPKSVHYICICCVSSERAQPGKRWRQVCCGVRGAPAWPRCASMLGGPARAPSPLCPGAWQL